MRRLAGSAPVDCSARGFGPIFATSPCMSRNIIRNGLGAVGLLVAARLAARAWQASRYPLAGRVVLITGGSRGLGLLLAREYARQGARLVLAARDSAALERAAVELSAAGAEVMTVPCDVADRGRVDAMVAATVASFGRIDVVVNAAGEIEVGPMEAMTGRDFRQAMDTNFWGAFNVIDAALPHLCPDDSRIVNISSIGGLVSVPHLLPYSASKFALTGYSLGLRMELAQRGIPVITVCPGLMRTGSPINAKYKGNATAEHAWFSVADSLPFVSMSGQRAARAIVRASRRGDALLVLGLPAKLAALANALLPASVARASSVVTRLLPQGDSKRTYTGAAIDDPPPAWLTALGDRAAAQNNELG
jgi:NAD(P)-dependent dehydrogenase (short-subunit alcohol dehydrogenase family)